MKISLLFEQKEEYVLEVDDRDHHPWVYVFYEYSVYFLGDHSQNDVWQFGLLYCWLESDVVVSATGVFMELSDDVVYTFVV